MQQLPFRLCRTDGLPAAQASSAVQSLPQPNDRVRQNPRRSADRGAACLRRQQERFGCCCLCRGPTFRGFSQSPSDCSVVLFRCLDTFISGGCHITSMFAQPYSWQRLQVDLCFLSNPSRISSTGAPIAAVIGSSNSDRVKSSTIGQAGSSGAW